MKTSTERNWLFWLGILCFGSIQLFAIIFVASEYRNKTDVHHSLLKKESKLASQVQLYQLESAFLSALSKVDRWAKENEMITAPSIKKQKIFVVPYAQQLEEK